MAQTISAGPTGVKGLREQMARPRRRRSARPCGWAEDATPLQREIAAAHVGLELRDEPQTVRQTRQGCVYVRGEIDAHAADGLLVSAERRWREPIQHHRQPGGIDRPV